MRLQAILVLLCLLHIHAAQKYNQYIKVSWNRTLLAPLQTLSEETTLINTYFGQNQGQGIGYLSIKQHTIEIQMSDKSKSNYTKRIFINIIISLAQITQQQDGFDSYQGQNSSLSFWVEKVKILNSSSEKQRIQQYLKSSMEYSYSYDHEDKLVLKSAQMTLEIKIGTVSILQFFLAFLIVENINGIISIIAMVFLFVSLQSEYSRHKTFIQYDILLSIFLVLNIYIFYLAQIPTSQIPFLLVLIPSTSFYIILLSSLLLIGLFGGWFFNFELNVRFEYKIMVFVLFWFLLFYFNSTSMALFTGYYIYSLYNTQIQQKEDSGTRMVMVIFTLILMHMTQFVSWINPGKNYETFREACFPVVNISLLTVLLVYFNSLISFPFVRSYFFSSLRKIIRWIKTRAKKEQKKTEKNTASQKELKK